MRGGEKEWEGGKGEKEQSEVGAERGGEERGIERKAEREDSRDWEES